MLTYILAFLFNGLSRSYRGYVLLYFGLRSSTSHYLPDFTLHTKTIHVRVYDLFSVYEFGYVGVVFRNVDWYIDSPGDGVNRHQREFNLCINRYRGTKAGMLTIKLAPSMPVSGVSEASWVLVISAPDQLNRIEFQSGKSSAE